MMTSEPDFDPTFGAHKRIRVRWECGASGCSVKVHEGRTWRPHPIFLTGGETEYAHAVRIGVCRDPLPEGGDPVLVQWDDRPGAIQAHTWKELEVVDEA